MHLVCKFHNALCAVGVSNFIFAFFCVHFNNLFCGILFGFQLYAIDSFRGISLLEPNEIS